MEAKEKMEDKIRNEESGSVVPIAKPLFLPSIPYDKEELTEIIEEIPIPSRMHVEITHQLAHIEQQVFAIRAYQAKKNPEHFYQSMQTAILDIQNDAHALCELTKTYHESLSNTLKQVILQWIVPLKAELAKRLEMPAIDRVKLELKTKHLYAEQSFICRQVSLQPVLMEHLTELKKLFEESGEPQPRCYISYAWPSEDRQIQEYWVQPFLFVFYDHLKETGVRMVMDIRDNRPGDSIHLFMQQYYDGNPIILVGTESLLDKHLSVVPHAVQTELSIISNRQGEDRKRLGQTRIYPMLISGTLRSAYPASYQLYSTVRDTRDSNIKEEGVELRDTRDQGYIGTLRKLIDWIYESRINQNKSRYIELWRKLDGQLLRLSKDSVAVEAEIALGYHRRRLDHLRQDIQYQSVEAQEEAKHSQAVSTKMIGVLMESIGNNAKTLFDANGQQFQRPYTNADFIVRPALWNKITQHFATTEQQILRLTAHGLGGTGKTELAGYYYQNPPRPYTLRAWFDAEKKEQLYYQYIDLAKANGIEYSKEMAMEEQARRVKSWLETRKDCLLVYDNVPNMKEIEELLPVQGKHHVLITSRNDVDWSTHQKLDVDVMEENEAINLILKITGYQENEENLKKLKELVNFLGCLPLALAQAGAYMSVKSLTIDNYLKLYQQYQAKFLTDITVRSPKHEPVWITFDMNFSALKEECPSALITLKQASWLNYSKIPEILLQMMVNNDEQQKELTWIDIKEYVKKYSLIRINVEQHELNIHPLLQDILRTKQDAKEQLKRFKECSDALNELEDSTYKSKLTIYKSLLLHAERLRNHTKELTVKIKDNKERDLILIEPACLNMFYLRFSLSQQALLSLEKTVLVYESFYGKNSIQVARALTGLATAYKELGERYKAKEYCERALRIKKSHYGKNNVEVAGTLVNFGILCKQSGEFEEAKEHYERALEIQERYYGKNHIETAPTLVNIGSFYRQFGKYELAKQYCERALNVQEQYYGENHIEITPALGNLGTIFRQLGDLNLAEKHYKRALKIEEQHYGADHFKVIVELVNLGIIYRQLENLEKSMEYCQRALEIGKQHYGENHIETVTALQNIGTIYLESEKFDQAREFYERVLKIEKEYYGDKDNAEMAVTLGNLGSVFLRIGNFELAKDNYKKALNIQERHYGEGHLETVRALGNLGTICLEQEDFELGKRHYEKVLNIQIKHYGEDHRDTAATLANLGNLYGRLGEFKKAIDYLEKAKGIYEHNFPQKGSPPLAKIKKLLEFLYEETNNTQEKISSLSAQGIEYYKAKKFDKALPLFQQALDLHKKISIESNETLAKLHFNIGAILIQQKNYSNAKPHLKSAYDIRLTLLGPNHSSTEKAKERLQECETKLQILTSSSLDNKSELAPYTLEHKIPIEDTSLIDHLKEVTHLPFKGVRDKDYQVDAIVNLENESAFEKAKMIQKDLKTGLFFQYHSNGQMHQAFVLEGINLPEGDPSIGEQIRTYLLQKGSKI